MFLEFDWTSNVLRPRLGDTFTDVLGWRSFACLQDADFVLRQAGLRRGPKTDSRTWRIES